MIIASSIIAILFAYLSVKHYKWSLIVLAGLLPLYMIRFDVGIPFTLLEILILITIARFFTLQPKLKSLLWKNKALPGIIILLIAATIGIFVAPDTYSALGIWNAYFIEPIFLFLIYTSTLKKQDWPHVFSAFMISALFVSLFGIFQWVFNIGIPVPWDIERRITSIFPYPNAVGLYVAPIIGIAVTSLITKMHKPILPILTVIFGSIAIVLAETEAAFVAIPAGLLIAFLFSKARAKMKLITAGISALIGLLLFAFIPIVKTKLTLQDYSGQVRLSQWSETMEMLKTRPLFGSGLNGYPEALAPFHDPSLYEIFQYPHNLFLNIWTELGLLGILGFFILTFAALRYSSRDPLSIVVIASLSIMLIHGMVDVPYFKNDLAVMTWVLLAVLFMQRSKKII